MYDLKIYLSSIWLFLLFDCLVYIYFLL